MKRSDISLFIQRTLTRISPALNMRWVYFHHYHKFIHLKKPVTFDEKIQWLKLHDYGTNPVVQQCADKLAVRDYVEAKGCGELLNPLYAAYERVEDIDWDALPNQFAIKLNSGSGFNMFCRDKKSFDIEGAKKTLSLWMKKARTVNLIFAENQYKHIPIRILFERFIDTGDGTLPADYKLFCFNGEAKYMMLCTKRETGHPEFYFFDRKRRLVRLNKRGLAAPKGFTIDFPEVYDQLFDYASRLTQGFPFVRADFYVDGNHIIFGELTFTPSAGYDGNIPEEQNRFIGSLIHLPQP